MPHGPDAKIQSSAVIRVLIAIQSQNELGDVRSAFAPHADLEIVGALGDGNEVIRMLSSYRPNVVLVDMFLPGMEGLETTLRIKSTEQPPRVIVMTPEDGEAYKLAIEQAEADGYVPYPLLDKILVPLIRSFFQRNCAT